MKHGKSTQRGLQAAVLAVTGLMMALGISQTVAAAGNNSGTVAAEQCISLKTDLAGTIGGSPQCGDFGMAGVTFLQGEGGAKSYSGNGCTLTVDTDPVGSTGSTSFTVSGDCPAELVLTKGVSGNNSCQFLYPSGVPGGDTVTNKDSKGKDVPAKSLTVCTDGEALASPKLVLEVGVVAVSDGNAPDCTSGVTKAIQIGVGETVGLCYTVTNAGDATLTGVAVDSQTAGDLDPAETQTISGGVVTYSDAGIFYPSATATGTYQGTTVTSNLDTAVVFAEAPETPAVVCDVPTETPATNNGRLYASFDPENPEENYECAPTFDSGQRQCLNDCYVDEVTGKADCDRPSGEWDPTNQCEPKVDGKLPYCWEIRANPICESAPMPAKYWKEVSKTVTYLKRNPYIMQSCTSSGGRQTCITYCFLYAGESANRCPAGSYIYR